MSVRIVRDVCCSDELPEMPELPEVSEGRRGVKRKFDEVEDLNPNLMQKIIEITHVKYNDMRQVIRERKKNQPTFSREFFLTKMMRNLTAMYSPVQCNPICDPNQMASDENYWLKEEDARPVTPGAAAAAVAASNTSLQAPVAQYSHSPMQYAYNYNTQPQYPYQYDMAAAPYHNDSGNAYNNMYHGNSPYNSSSSEYHSATGNAYESMSLGSPFETSTENMSVSSPSSTCQSSGYTSSSGGYDNTPVSSPYEITTVRSDYDSTVPVSTYHNLTAPSSYQNSVASTYANMKGGAGYVSATAMDDAMDISSTSSQGTQHVSTGVTRNELESLAATLAPMWEETDNSTMLPSIETYISNDQYEYVWKILATAQS
jgi:hypothetical protein